MSEIQRLPPMMNPNPVHPNAKTTTQITNGTTTAKTNIGSPVCRNCKTQTTPLWRRDETGQVLCNACGLFLKLHGRARPISLKTDTIKSRNRIKQPNFSKSSGPNTPELKSKDSKVSIQPNMGAGFQNHGGQPQQRNGADGTSTGHHSPLLAGKRPSVADSVYATSSNIHSPLQLPVRQAPFSSGSYPLGVSGFLHAGLPHQVQSLHYPSSTPTQFAPGLQRITSPLLLSTTPSMSNARSSSTTASRHPSSTTAMSPQSSLTAMQAAGALENMSNELGPSAVFKNGNSSSSPSVSGVSLLGNSAFRSRPESSTGNTPTQTLSNSPKPSLPALGSNNEDHSISSSSFGSKFVLHESQAHHKPLENPLPSLPPIKRLSGSLSHHQLPQLPSNLGSNSYSAVSTPELQSTPKKQGPQASHQDQSLSTSAHPPSDGSISYGSTQQLSGSNSLPSEKQGTNMGSSAGHAPGRNTTGEASQSGRQGGQDQQDRDSQNNNNNNSNNNNNNNNNGNGNGQGPVNSNTYEVNVLKTRISELELVNDLYRTRIMELEAMEQAARLRENSMRKRLDDVLRAQGFEDTSSMLTNTMKAVRRDESFDDAQAKRQKTE